MVEKEAELREMETRLESMAPLHELHQSVDSQNWSELSRLVDGLKTLAAARRSHSPPSGDKHTH